MARQVPRKRPFVIRTLAPAALLLLSLALWALVAGGARSEQVPDENSGVVTLPATAPGIYLVGSRPADNEVFGLVGRLMFFHWAQVHTGPGQFDWSLVDRHLANTTAEGKTAALAPVFYEGRLLGGVIAMPDWVKQEGSPTDPAATVLRLSDGWLVPQYWSPAFQASLYEFVDALGARYRGDPRLGFVAYGSGMYGETRAVDPQDEAEVEAAGFAANEFIEFTNELSQRYIDAFSTEDGLQSHLLIQSAPFTWSPAERRESSQYAAMRGVGISINGLWPDDNFSDARESPTCPRCGTFDAILDYGDQVPVAFEIDELQLPSFQDFYWAILNALDKGPDYLRVTSGLMMDSRNRPLPEYVAVLQWAKDYIGIVDLADAPSVWVALREHRDPFRGETSFYPQWGNFGFGLLQDDRVPGGRTVPEVNEDGLDSPRFNPILDDTPESWVARRTDQATANAGMFFKIDDSYLRGAGRPVTVTVRYYDVNVDTWTLRYDSIEGEKAAPPQGSFVSHVRKTGSLSWQTATFVIYDGLFQNGLAGGSDFTIDSNRDGDEWIHFVDVRAGSPDDMPTPTPTPTPTATATATPTPTATPSPTPHTGRVDGIVFEDRNGNGRHDPAEPPLSGAVLTLSLDQSGIVVTKTTGFDGVFLFEDLEPNRYRLEETDPPSFTSTTANLVRLTVAAIQVVSVDFGDWVPPVGRLGGYVWQDGNRNRRFDPGEAKLAGVAVTLYREDQPLRAAATLPDGTFEFDSVAPGTYRLVETDPVGYASSTANELLVAVGPGTELMNLNFGDYQPQDPTLGRVMGTVWSDKNGNGLREATEAVLPGVPVVLTAISASEAITHITGSDGLYRFDDLTPGTYHLTQVEVDAYTPTTPSRLWFLLGADQTVIVDFGNRPPNWQYLPSLLRGHRREQPPPMRR